MVIPLSSFLANFYYDDWQTLMFEPFVVVTCLAQRGTDQVHWSRGLCFDFSRLQCREWPCRDWPTHVTSDQGGGGPTGRAWGLSTQLHTASYKDICKAYICKQWFFNQFFDFFRFFVHVARRYFGRGRRYFGRGRRYFGRGRRYFGKL